MVPVASSQSCFFHSLAPARGDRVGVEAIGEVVADDRDGHDRCYGAAGLEGGTDGEAVHEAVPDQAGRG